MARFGPISRDDLIRGLRKAGFIGPSAGGKHPIMSNGNLTIHVPNPHGTNIGLTLLKKILHQAGISREEWEAL